MPKYEILLLTDPKVEENEIKSFMDKIFGTKISKMTKLENTELAYEINNSKTAFYYLVEINSESEDIKEFNRQSGISKLIWRHMIINLETEKTLKKPKKFLQRKWKSNDENGYRKDREFSYRKRVWTPRPKTNYSQNNGVYKKNIVNQPQEKQGVKSNKNE